MPLAEILGERLRIDLGGDLVAYFESRALIAGMSVEDYIARHLAKTRAYADDLAPIYLNDKQASEIRSLLGARIGGKKDLVEAIRQIMSWDVGGHLIPLPASVQEQIHWYARSLGKPVAEVAPVLVLEAIRGRFQA